MKMYYVVTFVGVFFLIHCSPSEEEKLASALREVERLDEMRKKTSEIIKEQESNLLLEVREYQEWEDLERELLSYRNLDIAQAEKKLTDWKNWHIVESKRLWDQHMAPYEREISYKEDALFTLRTDSVHYANQSLKYQHNAGGRHFSWFLAAIKDSIVKITADLERLKNNPPKLTKPQKRTDEISHWEKALFNAKEVYRRQKEEKDRMRAIKIQNLAKMRADLALTKASYESINALHTKAVFELSKK